MNKLVYVAHPIDQDDIPSATWRPVLHHFLVNAKGLSGVMVFDPQAPWWINRETQVDPRLDQVNREVIKRADALVAFAPAGVPSVGTYREIEQARNLGIPTLVLTDQERSWALADTDSRVGLTYKGVEIVLGWLDTLVPGRLEQTHSLSTELAFSMNNHGGKLPVRSYEQDAGFDLFVNGDHVIDVGEFADIDCGVRVAMPLGIYGRITGRSSTMRRRNLLVVEGVIDGGWRGPLFAGVRNLGEEPVLLNDGDRIAQLILHPNVTAQYTPTWINAADFADLPHDGRGINGFGSSGS